MNIIKNDFVIDPFQKDYVDLRVLDFIWVWKHPVFDIPAQTLPLFCESGSFVWNDGWKYRVIKIINKIDAIESGFIIEDDFLDEEDNCPVVVCEWVSGDKEQLLRDIKISKVIGE